MLTRVHPRYLPIKISGIIFAFKNIRPLTMQWQKFLQIIIAEKQKQLSLLLKSPREDYEISRKLRNQMGDDYGFLASVWDGVIRPVFTRESFVLSAPPDRKKLKIMQLFIIRVADHGFKLEQKIGTESSCVGSILFRWSGPIPCLFFWLNRLLVYSHTLISFLLRPPARKYVFTSVCAVSLLGSNWKNITRIDKTICKVKDNLLNWIKIKFGWKLDEK